MPFCSEENTKIINTNPSVIIDDDALEEMCCTDALLATCSEDSDRDDRGLGVVGFDLLSR